ncbi:MAG: hypothetical protein E7537_03325 [Ruminococcaceae bacterium]|nr:hypothetical protein [Oscillospiraceae bacterium]
MAIGFKKSLFGFNCDDVINYIERLQRKFKNKTEELNQKTQELENELNISKENYQKLLEEKNDLSEKLDSISQKTEEIERLSENIGKLYLVSQANAQVVMSSAQQNSSLAKSEVEKNISAIEEAHISLNELRQSIRSTSENFIKEVDVLLGSLDATREQISKNIETSQTATQDFEKVYESIVNE